MLAGDLPYAQQFRDIILELVTQQINATRPTPSLATVVSVDRPNKTCMIQYPGPDEVPVKVRMYTIQPTGAGDIVRIEGSAGNKYITEVVSGASVLAGVSSTFNIADYRVSDLSAANKDLPMGGFKIINLATPTATTDAVNKAYADTKAASSHTHDLGGSTVTGRLPVSKIDLTVFSTSHLPEIAEINGLDLALNAKAPLSHTHAIGDLPVAASGVSSATALVRADDARLSDARTPTAHTHTKSNITDFAHTHAIGDLPVATSGTSSSTQLVRADDSRLSNARTPTAHTHTKSQITDFAHTHAIADLPVAASGTSSTTQLVRADDSRLSDARTPVAHTHSQSDINGLAATLAAKADLVGGKIPTSQIPSIALGNAVPVASQAAMLALTSAQIQPGDVAVRSDGAGTFMLIADDPSVLANWQPLSSSTDVVTSVNGQVGTVSLGATDVGARPSSWVPAWTDVTGKPTTFTPSTHTHTKSQITDFAHTHAIADLPVAASGTSSSTQLVRADDSRLSNARTPTAHTHAVGDITGLFDSTAPAALGASAAGSAIIAARRDHVHAMPTAAQVGAAAAVHGHALTDANITGVLPNAQLPSRLQEYAQTITDWDLAGTDGIYMASDALNAPGAGWYIGYVLAHNSIWTVQTVYPFTASGLYSGSDTGVYRRVRQNNVWGAWYRLRESELELDTRYMRSSHTATAANRASDTLTGGGTITCDSAYNFKWTTRFIAMATGRGTHWASNGYFDINMPSAGVVIPGYAGATNKTVVAAGIPLAAWDALYFIPTVGGAGGSFAVVAYQSGTFEVPDHWVFIAIRGESGQVRLGNGMTMYANQSITVSNPYPQYSLTSHTHTLAQLPVAASGVSSSTQLVRADDARLSDARTPVAHTHTKSQITDFAHTHAIADLPVAASGVSSTTQLVRADDARLSNARTPVAHSHTASDITSGVFNPDRLATGSRDEGYFLRSDGTWAWPGAAIQDPVVQVFTASGTWTKPAGCTKYDAYILGAGGAGGSGAALADNSVMTGGGGGGGGGGGAVIISGADARTLTTVSVTVGAPGAAGTVGYSDGGPGGDGGSSAFGVHGLAEGGKGGGGGLRNGIALGGAGGSGSGPSVSNGKAGGDNDVTVAANASLAGSGGGSGGYVQQYNASTFATGKAGGANTLTGASGGTGGTASVAAGAGGASTAATNRAGGGGGGGGTKGYGASGTPSVGGAGGLGSGGGGGGGISQWNGIGKAGGIGGAGIVIITARFD